MNNKQVSFSHIKTIRDVHMNAQYSTHSHPVLHYLLCGIKTHI